MQLLLDGSVVQKLNKEVRLSYCKHAHCGKICSVSLNTVITLIHEGQQVQKCSLCFSKIKQQIDISKSSWEETVSAGLCDESAT